MAIISDGNIAQQVCLCHLISTAPLLPTFTHDDTMPRWSHLSYYSTDATREYTGMYVCR